MIKPDETIKESQFKEQTDIIKKTENENSNPITKVEKMLTAETTISSEKVMPSEEPMSEEERTQHEFYMRHAIKQAKKAYQLEEVPIGCVIVYEGKIIARGYNRRNTDKNTLSHAELNAIRKASKKLGDWRLEGCTLYVTLEPCQMCAGAIVQARVSQVIIGSMNPKAGCAGSILNLLENSQFNHQVKTHRGILETESTQMLSTFFKELRQKKKQLKILKK